MRSHTSSFEKKINFFVFFVCVLFIPKFQLKIVLANFVFLLIRFRGVFGTFQLDFEPFGANLKAVHGLNGRLGAHWIIVRHETF
jgi:hypothetical protein